MDSDGGPTLDGFLGGRISLWQPHHGYRAATDPVLLAAAVPARPGQSALELGCGVGTASLCLLSRLPGLSVTGIERQADYADLARRNAADNHLDLTVLTADLASLPAELRGHEFDHVLANPPYFRPDGGTPARNPGREGALREDTPLTLWIDAGLRRLRPGGWLTMIHLAERLGEILALLPPRAGSVSILPVAPRPGRAANRVLVRARKGGKAPLRLLAPLILHDGVAHLSDGDDYTATARAVLRHCAALADFD